jgi:fructose-bisphosphate aldolase class I
MDFNKLNETTERLVSPGKGILATDATEGTMDKRMKAVGIDPTPELRRKFREILLKTPNISQYICGVILNDEIIRQKTSDDLGFVALLDNQGIVPGIKVDKKTHNLANFPGEKIAEGLDGLRDRFAEYKNMGAKFSKWRTVIVIGDGIPTDVCIESNSEVLARYAALAQEADIVPIVEPEVLMDGNHGIERSEEITKKVLKSVFKKLTDHKIYLKGMLLKPNVVHPGKGSPEAVDNEQVVQRTLKVLNETVPADVPGIFFLSGGDSAPEMTQHLDRMNEFSPHPWELSFSFERALEGPAMGIWKGQDGNIERAQQEFLKRAKLNSLARSGQYSSELENS